MDPVRDKFDGFVLFYIHFLMKINAYFLKNKYSVPRVLPQGGPKFEKVHVFKKIHIFFTVSHPRGGILGLNLAKIPLYNKLLYNYFSKFPK